MPGLPEKGEVGGATSEWRWPRRGGSSAPRTAKPLKNGLSWGLVPCVLKRSLEVWCRAATGTYNTARKIFDIIRAMRTKARNAVALSLAIAGAVASPLRSDAVSRKGSTPPPSMLYSILRAA